MSLCHVQICTRRAYALELCDAHYRRFRSTGDVWAHVPLYTDGRSHPKAISRTAYFRFHDLTRIGDFPELDPALGSCIVWTGALSNGYGHFGFDGIIVPAHRFAWFLEHGEEVPEWLVLDHLCCVSACVRVSHLEPVTVAENSRRGGLQQRLRRKEREKARRSDDAESQERTEDAERPEGCPTSFPTAALGQDLVHKAT